MGMYTELVLSCNVRPDDAAIPVLRYMCRQGEEPPTLPDHPLFHTERWSILFKSNSYYHVPRSHASIEFDHISNEWTLIVRSDLKNYGGEIEKFVDWIAPYIADAAGRQMIGYSRYEECEEPTILYVNA